MAQETKDNGENGGKNIKERKHVIMEERGRKGEERKEEERREEERTGEDKREERKGEEKID